MPSVDVPPLRSPQRTILGRYRTNNGQILILAGYAYDANDPKQTSPNWLGNVSPFAGMR